MTMACPACPGEPGEGFTVEVPGAPTHQLLLPGISCAGCIRGVERALAACDGITDARVNLTTKRVAITARPGADPTPWIEALAQSGYEAHEAGDQTIADNAGQSLLAHLGVAGFAMMNVMLLSVAVWSGAADTTREFLHWISAAIALPATAFAAQPFFRNAWRALSAGRLDMDVPISLAILLACGMSLWEVAHGGAHAWFDAALSLTFFLLVGRYLDQRMRQVARSAARDLAALEPARVIRIEGGQRVRRPLAEVAVGDILWLEAGARVPVDGVLAGGTIEIDRSAITGESTAISCRDGDALVAGDVALSGPLSLRATAVGEDTTLRRTARLMAQAETARSKYSGLAARAAAVYTPLVHIIAAAAFTGWLAATGDIRMALNVAIATLIITCPCALGLAVPAVGVAATSRLYRQGVLVKSDTALERLAGIDTVLFDKTGTLTRPGLTPPSNLGSAETQVLRALADASAHPLCRSLRSEMGGIAPAPLDRIAEEAGSGVTAQWQGVPVRLGRGENGETSLAIGDRQWPLERRDTPLPDATDAVADLKARGYTVCLITGDSADAAARQDATFGFDRVWSAISPEGKCKAVQALQNEGHKVLMVGDGLNDAAALAAADASIAPGSALDISRSAADLVLVSGRLGDIAATLETASTARRRILQNFAIAAVYNMVAVPAAVAGLATPLAAAIAMSASSLTVISNALRLR